MAVVQMGSTTVAGMLRRLIILLVPFALVLGACSDDDDTPKATTTTERDSTSSSSATSSTTAPNRGPGTTASTAPTSPGRTLTGPGGTGKLSWSVVPNRSEFCYQISLDSHSAASGARLYRGSTGETGDVVLELIPPGADGTVNKCSAGDQLLVEEIRAEPERFYVLVTTAKGTLRAQLA
jgi:hypothetical protein